MAFSFAWNGGSVLNSVLKLASNKTFCKLKPNINSEIYNIYGPKIKLPRSGNS